MTPFEKSNLADNIISNNNTLINKKLKYKIGQYVRVPDKRNVFSKSYTTNWSRELFKIKNINNTHPVTYTIEDQSGEKIEGKYYEQELLKSEFNFETNKKTLLTMNIEI